MILCELVVCDLQVMNYGFSASLPLQAYMLRLGGKAGQMHRQNKVEKRLSHTYDDDQQLIYMTVPTENINHLHSTYRRYQSMFTLVDEAMKEFHFGKRNEIIEAVLPIGCLLMSLWLLSTQQVLNVTNPVRV